jgi:hypothetical protein
MFRSLRHSPALVALSLMAAALALARDVRTERVQFARGANSSVVEGSIQGYETVDYVLGAKKGQPMNVSMATDNSANFFNILAPGENEGAMFDGSISQNQYEGVLPESGDYKIRVYLERSAARRNEVGKYRLEMILAGTATDAARPAAAREKGSPNAVPELSDLVGVRGSAAETQMQARGYRAVGGHSEPHASVTYWRNSSDGSCVSVRTADGRYQAIARASAQDCDRAAAATPAVETPDPGGYRTVCGVFVDGKPVRYVCSVVGGDQRVAPTTLRFPDIVMVLHWQGAKGVRIEIEGSAPIQATWSESEGETDIVSSEKTGSTSPIAKRPLGKSSRWPSDEAARAGGPLHAVTLPSFDGASKTRSDADRIRRWAPWNSRLRRRTRAAATHAVTHEIR